jgi:dTDP-4-dehydrorhamnose reductase
LKILILGSTGLIGYNILRVFVEQKDWSVFGSIRSEAPESLLPKIHPSMVVNNLDVDNFSSVINLLQDIKPNVVINCIGATKQKKEGNVPEVAINLNALFPHKLANLCESIDSRLIHITTDCVFSGKLGSYSEDCLTDAEDLYGKSKALGEVNYGNVITLRTSTIGHELYSNHGLLDWFLAQNDSCRGFTKAIFSGFPAIIFAQIIRDFVIPNLDLKGLFNVASAPINKYDLLQLIAKVYNKQIKITPDDTFKIDRSLDASKFNQATGYKPSSWQSMIRVMHDYGKI